MAGREAIAVQVPGLGALRRDLKRLGDDLSDYKDTNQRVGAVVVAEAEDRAPRKSGRLAGSGRASRAATRVTVLWGGARAAYAGPIHWGWAARGIDAQPFVADAAVATEGTWLPLYQQHIDDNVARLAGRTY